MFHPVGADSVCRCPDLFTVRIRLFLRATSRLCHFGGLLAAAGIDFAWQRSQRSVRSRAEWMQCWSRRILRSLAVEVEIQGQPMRVGMVVCNHLSYLDILVLGTQQPMVFVSKSEVRKWPILGPLVACAGTVFLERQKRGDLVQATTAMQAVVGAGISVAFFPEGTTTDGSYVRPFHAGLFEPAVTQKWNVTPAWIGYELPDGSTAAAVSYWGDMTFLPHFLKLLTQPPITTRVHWGERLPQPSDRKQLAALAHQAVVSLQNQRSSGNRPVARERPACPTPTLQLPA